MTSKSIPGMHRATWQHRGSVLRWNGTDHNTRRGACSTPKTFEQSGERVDFPSVITGTLSGDKTQSQSAASSSSAQICRCNNIPEEVAVRNTWAWSQSGLCLSAIVVVVGIPWERENESRFCQDLLCFGEDLSRAFIKHPCNATLSFSSSRELQPFVCLDNEASPQWRSLQRATSKRLVNKSRRFVGVR